MGTRTALDSAVIEPLLIGSRHREELAELALDLVQRSSGFCRSLPPGMRTSFAELARIMNCYYSNLIEGNDTHPVDIERALRNEYSQDKRERDLQLEAKAHVTVQQWIDNGGLKGGRAVTERGIREVHKRFYELLPEDLLWVDEPETNRRVRVAPGEPRDCDVRVWGRLAINPGAVPRFLQSFEQVYGSTGKMESILSIAAAHHRLLWIHPFLDGNARVARLMSHATMLEALESGGVWPLARGMARDVQQYRILLANCSALTDETLVEFTRFFLKVCIDQVNFMENLARPDRLRARILVWAEEEIRLGHLPAKSGSVLEALLYRGEIPRGEAQNIVGTGERQARRVVSALVEAGVLTAESPRAPLRLVFPATLASRWMPGLFPEKMD
jgi:Fic family protein